MGAQNGDGAGGGKDRRRRRRRTKDDGKEEKILESGRCQDNREITDIYGSSGSACT